MPELSDVQQFYNGSTIFLTGATGYVGKLTLEKLLRACPDFKRIYLLIRVKKGVEPNQRLAQLFECPIFDLIKKDKQDFEKLLTKLCVITGDLSFPNLGMKRDDIATILEEVDIVIHSGATVRFDEKLRDATKINTMATRDLIELAKNMKKLKAHVHISTAYSNCDRERIEEVIYPPKLECQKLIDAVNALDDDLLFDMQKRLLGKLPNTYTLTKQIAEDVVKQEGQDLPVIVVRPSINMIERYCPNHWVF